MDELKSKPQMRVSESCYDGPFVMQEDTDKPNKLQKNFAAYTLVAIVIGFSAGSLLGEFLDQAPVDALQAAVSEPAQVAQTPLRNSLQDNVAETAQKSDSQITIIRGLEEPKKTKLTSLPSTPKPITTWEPLDLLTVKEKRDLPVISLKPQLALKTTAPKEALNLVQLQTAMLRPLPEITKSAPPKLVARVAARVPLKPVAITAKARPAPIIKAALRLAPRPLPTPLPAPEQQIEQNPIVEPRFEQDTNVNQSPWQKHAVAHTIQAGRPMIAIVIDDLGVAASLSERAVNLPGPLTMSFLPYGHATKRLAKLASEKGHELMVHVPMEPNGHENPGPRALKIHQTSDEVRENLIWALSQFNGYVGINNHMGSRFTRNREALQTVISHVEASGLLYLDSLTSGSSVAGSLARNHDMPFVKRDIFLDHEIATLPILESLQKVEQVARQKGTAIAIGHPHRITVEILERWLATASERGFDIVPVTTIYKARQLEQKRLQQVADAHENNTTF